MFRFGRLYVALFTWTFLKLKQERLKMMKFRLPVWTLCAWLMHFASKIAPLFDFLLRPITTHRHYTFGAGIWYQYLYWRVTSTTLLKNHVKRLITSDLTSIIVVHPWLQYKKLQMQHYFNDLINLRKTCRLKHALLGCISGCTGDRSM